MPIGTSAGAFYNNEMERDMDWSAPSNMPIIPPDEVMGRSPQIDQQIEEPMSRMPPKDFKLPSLEDFDLKMKEDESYFRSLTPNVDENTPLG